MEEFDKIICNILQEITNFYLDSVTDLSNGYLLSVILYSIDNEYFVKNDPLLDNWTVCKNKLESFLIMNGICNQPLDFEISQIENKQLDAAVSAFLQIFAIIATFNTNYWDSIINNLSNSISSSFKKFLDKMINEIKTELKISTVTPNKNNSSVDTFELIKKIENQQIQINSLNLTKVYLLHFH